MQPLYQLPLSRWRVIAKRKSNWANWTDAERIREKRIQWIWRIACSGVLLVVIFLLIGGCK